MKVLLVLALAIATVSAGVMPQSGAMQPQLGRITNGQNAAENQFPYQVGLQFERPGGTRWCGGSIIDNQWVLTTAKCTAGTTSVTIYYGSTVRTSGNPILTVSRSNFIEHADYDATWLTNNIALIKTPFVTFTASINKVVLPSISKSYSDFAGQKAIASGWGKISDAATAVTNILQFATFDVVSVSKCQDSYPVIIASSNVICIATPNRKSTCSGDTGGPLVLASDKKLIGLTSFVGKKGCESGEPAGFTRVTSYLDWIKKISNVSY